MSGNVFEQIMADEQLMAEVTEIAERYMDSPSTDTPAQRAVGVGIRIHDRVGDAFGDGVNWDVVGRAVLRLCGPRTSSAPCELQ